MNNWDRINLYRRHWEERQARTGQGDSWTDEFARLVFRKELYQDRVIILSEGGYSNVSASDVGMNEESWNRLSIAIRLEHECTHYFTRRVFGSMQNAVHDEFLADYAGIVSATGKYSSCLFLLFMGLEKFPLYREGGRLQNYLGGLQSSQRIFEILKQIVKSASENLEIFFIKSSSQAKHDKKHMLPALASLHLDDLASDDSGNLIEAALQKVCS